MKKNPNPKDMTITGEVSQRLKDFINDLKTKVQNDDDDRDAWKSKMVAASHQRLGVKRYSANPYPGAPDIPLPETDKLIKKAIPNYVLSIWSAKKLCTVQVEQGVAPNPEWEHNAKLCEMAMNQILRTKMDLFYKLCLASEYLKEKGHCIFRVIEQFKSRMVHKVIDLDDYSDDQVSMLKSMKKDELRNFVNQRYSLDPDDKDDQKIVDDVIKQFENGDTVIEFDIPEINSLPQIEVPLPTKIIVPSYTTDINKAVRVTFEYELPKHEIQQLMDEGIFMEKDLEAMEPTGNEDDYVEESKGRNEGVENNSKSQETYRIRETCCWWNEEEGKPLEKWVFTYFADIDDEEEALLQRIKYPFEFDGWNYEKCDNERKDPRYHNSRGIPEQNRALQEMMERVLNNLLIRDEMNNNPSWEVVKTSSIFDMGTRFVPGELYPVDQLGTEIRKLNEPIGVDVSSERILQLLKAYSEEYQASSDQLFRNATNAGGGKTLGEIKEGTRANSGPMNLEIINWNECLSKVFKKVFDIMADRLGDSIWVDGNEITKEHFNFPAEVRANGTLEVADKQLSVQKAWMRLGAISNPNFADVVNSEDKFNALSDWLEKDGIQDPTKYCTHPMEIMKTQLAQAQQQLQMMGQQIQQGQKMIEDQAREIAKDEKKKKLIISKAEGEMQAIIQGPHKTKKEK